METPLRGEDEDTDETERPASEPQTAEVVSRAAYSALKSLADSRSSCVSGLSGERFMVFGQRVLALGANPRPEALVQTLLDVKNLDLPDIRSEMCFQLSTPSVRSEPAPASLTTEALAAAAPTQPEPAPAPLPRGDGVDTLTPATPALTQDPDGAGSLPGSRRGFSPRFLLAAGFLAGGVLGGASINFLTNSGDSASSNPQAVQIEILPADGIPADSALAVKQGEDLPDKIQIDSDVFVGPVGPEVVGVVLTNPDGTPYVIPHGAQDTVYAEVVNLVVSSKAETHPLRAQNPARYAAVLNARVVESSFPKVRRWEELMDGIQDTEEAYSVLTGMLDRWGGYQAVLTAVESENKAREERGDAPIAKPSELLRWIAEDSELPHSGVVALKIAEEASLIDHSSVAKNLRTVHDRLEAGRGRVESIAKTLTEKDLKNPLASLEQPPVRTAGLGASPSALASSHDVPEAGVSSEQARVWRETHPSRQENNAVMEANTQQWQASLLGLSRVVAEEKGPLNKMARGKNRELLNGVLDKFSSYLDERIREPAAKTLEELREQSSEIKNYFFNECLSLLNRVHGHYSDYLRVFASKVLQQLAESYKVLLARQGVEGTQKDVHAAVLATLPSGFFKAS